MSTFPRVNIAAHDHESNRLVGNTVQAMRLSLGVTVDELSKASGVPCPNIDAIERGEATTRAERHDIAIAVAWLADNHVAKGLTTRRRGRPNPAAGHGKQG